MLCQLHSKLCDRVCLDSDCTHIRMCSECQHEHCKLPGIPKHRLDDIMPVLEQMEIDIADAKSESLEHLLVTKERVKNHCHQQIDRMLDRLFDKILESSRDALYAEVIEKVHDLKSEFDMDDADPAKKASLVRWLRVLTHLPANVMFGRYLSKAQVQERIEEKANEICGRIETIGD